MVAGLGGVLESNYIESQGFGLRFQVAVPSLLAKDFAVIGLLSFFLSLRPGRINPCLAHL